MAARVEAWAITPVILRRSEGLQYFEMSLLFPVSVYEPSVSSMCSCMQSLKMQIYSMA